MQGSDFIPVNRRAMDFDDYVDSARRHKAWIFGPAFAGLVISVVAAFLWPDTFVSAAAIRVTPPQISEKLVVSNINVDMSQRISSMAQNILSRATLTNIIQTYGLYPKEIKRLPIEDLIEEMRNKYIKIGGVTGLSGNAVVGEKRNYGSFQVSFAYDNRYIAQRVCQDLVGRFLSENTRESLTQGQAATDFLKEELETARKKLDSIENNWAQFRIANAGRLPDDRTSNLSTLQSMETRMSNLNAGINRVNQEKLMLETQLRIARDQLTAAKSPIESPAAIAAMEKRNDKLIEKEREVQLLENNLLQAKEHWTENHPDVRRFEGLLAIARRQRDQIQKDDEIAKARELVSGPKPESRKIAPMSKEAKALEGQAAQIEALLKSKDQELDEYVKETSRINGTAKQFQSRLDATPLSDQKYQELTRDYDQAKSSYKELSEKKAISERATIVTGRKQGETLEMLDPASLPLSPSEPNRALIVGAGTAAGLLLGLFLAGARELKDTALKNLKDVRTYTQLTILGCIPLLENDLVVRRRRRLTLVAWSTASFVGIGIMLSSVFYYMSTRP